VRQNLVAVIEHMCYYFNGKQFKANQIGIVFLVMLRRETVRLLRLAVERERWDLAAHTIVLATASVLKNGEKPYANKSKEKKGRPKGQSKR
jgi:hypothetical protein